jgi:hypothetical protein
VGVGFISPMSALRLIVAVTVSPTFIVVMVHAPPADTEPCAAGLVTSHAAVPGPDVYPHAPDGTASRNRDKTKQYFRTRFLTRCFPFDCLSVASCNGRASPIVASVQANARRRAAECVNRSRITDWRKGGGDNPDSFNRHSWCRPV